MPQSYAKELHDALENTQYDETTKLYVEMQDREFVFEVTGFRLNHNGDGLFLSVNENQTSSHVREREGDYKGGEHNAVKQTRY